MKILTIAGARPNFMKVAPLCRAVAAHNEIRSEKPIKNILVHTGQHYDTNMSDAFFEDLRIQRPDYCLGVGSGSHAYQVGQTMIKIEEVMLKERPDWVVVVGDVNATVACSLTAKKLGFRVAHVEAGLRSHDWSMPEEINRVVTDRLSDVLFTPCPFADENLRREGMSEEKIVRVGNIMIDSLEMWRRQAESLDVSEVVRKHAAVLCLNQNYKDIVAGGLQNREFILLTMHRPSNVDDEKNLKKLIDLFESISVDLPVLFPVHPRTQKQLLRLKSVTANSKIIFMEPVGYLEMLCLSMRAKTILTDSGGLQEEACVLGVPCLTMRDNTERPITLIENGGTNSIVGNNPAVIKDTLVRCSHLPRKESRPELWDGCVAKRIVKKLIELNQGN